MRTPGHIPGTRALNPAVRATPGSRGPSRAGSSIAEPVTKASVHRARIEDEFFLLPLGRFSWLEKSRRKRPVSTNAEARDGFICPADLVGIHLFTMKAKYCKKYERFLWRFDTFALEKHQLIVATPEAPRTMIVIRDGRHSQHCFNNCSEVGIMPMILS